MASPLVFSKGEMKKRVARAQALMKRQKLDAMFLTGEEDFQYFTGVSGTICLHYSTTRPAAVIVPSEGDPIAIVGTASETPVKSAVKDVRTYNTTTGVPLEIYTKALKDVGLANKRVGLEEGLEMRIGQPLGEVLGLMRALSGIKFVDVAPLIWEMRMTKSREELELMKSAAKVTARARQKTFDECRVGDTQREIAGMFSKFMLRYGADRVAFVHVATNEPVNLTQFHSERPIRKGDMLYIDGGAYVRTHCIDYPRLGTVGKASDKQVRNHKAIRKACSRMAEAVRPNATCRDVWSVGNKAIKDAGFVSFDVGRYGHGQGMLATEPPSISAGDRTLLKPGMVLGVEPFSSLGDTPIIWEDVYVVTHEGSERLTFETSELRVVN
jgi:Xaa-Pro dipeptidase